MKLQEFLGKTERRATVAAGAVATKEAAPITIAGGVPAKFIKKMSQE